MFYSREFHKFWQRCGKNKQQQRRFKQIIPKNEDLCIFDEIQVYFQGINNRIVPMSELGSMEWLHINEIILSIEICSDESR